MFVYRCGVKPGPLPRRRGTPAVFYAQSPCILHLYITLLLLLLHTFYYSKKMYSIYFCSILTSSTHKRRVGWWVGAGVLYSSRLLHTSLRFARTYTTPLTTRPSLPPFGLPLFTIYFGRTRIVIFSDFPRSAAVLENHS